MSLFFAQSRPSCPKDGSNPRVYYQASDAKPIRFLTPKRAKKMNRGLDKLASLTQAQREEILKSRSRVLL